MQMKLGEMERSESGKGTRTRFLIILPFSPIPSVLPSQGKSHREGAPSTSHAGLAVIRCSARG